MKAITLERILSRENLLLAHRKVVSNKGAPGVDEMRVEELMGYCQQHWAYIRQLLLSGQYVPRAVKSVKIPKADGGERELGIPCVIDRLIQQAIAQVLSSELDEGFSDSSFGFRPRRSCHDAIVRSLEYFEAGFTRVVNLDLEKFFDRVNHDRLMHRLSQITPDRKLLKLIRKYLTTGILDGGVTSHRHEGTPQGSPLSPILSNIVLDEFDKELERRGLRFVRYADDANIFVKTTRAGARVYESISRFIEKRLRLKVNRKKSSVCGSTSLVFLGHRFYKDAKGYKPAVARKSWHRLRTKIRSKLRRWRGQSLSKTIMESKRIMRGWLNYFKLCRVRTQLQRFESWLLRHFRKIVWRQWKTCRTRFEKLQALGVNRPKAAKAAFGRGGPWFSAATSAMNYAYRLEILRSLGYTPLQQLHSARL
jgi:RNA-directed DNA polymerase